MIILRCLIGCMGTPWDANERYNYIIDVMYHPVPSNAAGLGNSLQRMDIPLIWLIMLNLFDSFGK